MIRLNIDQSLKRYVLIVLLGLPLVVLFSCTTLKARNKSMMDDYNTINWEDGINQLEASYIVKYYMHIENSYQGIRYFYPDKPIDMGDKWQFDTEFRNSSYERNPDQLLVVFIDKKTGKVAAKTIDDGSNRAQIVKEFEKVDRSDGINMHEAIAISKYHYYIEARNRYWMYKIDFNPTEGKRYWIFELSQDTAVTQSNISSGKELKSIEGLYLVINKKTGSLTKERSFLKFIR